MRVNRLLMPIVFIGVFGGTILLAQAAGLWSVSGRTAVNVEKLTAADLKGWMTLQQIIDGFGISKQELYAIVNIPDDVPTSTALKDLEKIVSGFETSTLRESLIAHEGDAPPLEVKAIATEAIVVTAEPTKQATAVATTGAAHTSDGSGTGPIPLPGGQVLPAAQIKGTLTLHQVSEQCAVSLDAVLRELQLPPETNPDTQIKMLIEQGILSEVAQVRDAVARLQAQ